MAINLRKNWSLLFSLPIKIRPTQTSIWFFGYVPSIAPFHLYTTKSTSLCTHQIVQNDDSVPELIKIWICYVWRTLLDLTLQPNQLRISSDSVNISSNLLAMLNKLCWEFLHINMLLLVISKSLLFISHNFKGVSRAHLDVL